MVVKNKNLVLSPSVIVLVLANLVPIFGVLFFSWDLFQIMFIYWAESAIVGIYSLLKLIISRPLAGLLYTPIFLIHFGIFMRVHLIFIFALFKPEIVSKSFLPEWEVIFSFLEMSMIPIGLLILSHGFSFIFNFINKKESEGKSIEDFMKMPYMRIATMHFTVILGGILLLIFKAPVIGLIFLIFLKTATDATSHLEEHKLDRKLT